MVEAPGVYSPCLSLYLSLLLSSDGNLTDNTGGNLTANKGGDLTANTVYMDWLQNYETKMNRNKKLQPTL